jgi:hypothetical protein
MVAFFLSFSALAAGGETIYKAGERERKRSERARERKRERESAPARSLSRFLFFQPV